MDTVRQTTGEIRGRTRQDGQNERRRTAIDLPGTCTAAEMVKQETYSDKAGDSSNSSSSISGRPGSLAKRHSWGGRGAHAAPGKARSSGRCDGAGPTPKKAKEKEKKKRSATKHVTTATRTGTRRREMGRAPPRGADPGRSGQI